MNSIINLRIVYSNSDLRRLLSYHYNHFHQNSNNLTIPHTAGNYEVEYRDEYTNLDFYRYKLDLFNTDNYNVKN